MIWSVPFLWAAPSTRIRKWSKKMWNILTILEHDQLFIYSCTVKRTKLCLLYGLLTQLGFLQTLLAISTSSGDPCFCLIRPMMIATNHTDDIVFFCCCQVSLFKGCHQVSKCRAWGDSRDEAWPEHLLQENFRLSKKILRFLQWTINICWAVKANTQIRHIQ